jgi:hypothetical protein
MQLTVTTQERALLEAILRDALGSVREEVYHTEEHRFKDDLKADEAAIRSLLTRVHGLPEA